MTSASVPVAPVTSERALARGRYSRSLIAASTRARAGPLTWPPFRTRETVLAPTPAWAATSAIVAEVRCTAGICHRSLDARARKVYVGARLVALPVARGSPCRANETVEPASPTRPERHAMAADVMVIVERQFDYPQPV